jgi:histidinol-phosphate aminotransferase
MTVQRKEADMALTRRSFVEAVGIGGAGLLAARRQAWAGLLEDARPAAAPGPLLLHNNENPLGPGEAVLEAVRAALSEGGPAGRYPWEIVPDLGKAIAERFGVAPENVVTGCGSTQVLRVAVQVFTSPARPLVAGQLTYEECAGYADLVGTPVRAIPLDRALQLDLGAMAEAAKGAGMVFLNNPNNPTGTVHSGEAVDGFVERVLAASPDAVVTIDEAYHDYVTDPSYRSQVSRAVRDPRVVVARTFSKAHGMAGMRVGYALGHPDTIKRLAGWDGPNALNVAGMVAAMASIKDQARLEREKTRNTEARKFTTDWFAKRGFSATDSQTNFVFVDIKRPAKAFREACREQGVVVARDFPPFEKSHVRISIGTLDEMKRATEVFGRVLGVRGKAAA